MMRVFKIGIFGTITTAVAIRVRLNGTQTFGHFVFFFRAIPSATSSPSPNTLGPKVPLRLRGQKAASMSS